MQAQAQDHLPDYPEALQAHWPKAALTRTALRREPAHQQSLRLRHLFLVHLQLHRLDRPQNRLHPRLRRG
jgi:hypothetical protein